MQISDAELVARALAGSESAYGELVRRYERPLFSLILRLVRDAAQAEDLAQDVFIKAIRALQSYDPSRKFSSWLFKIANNLAIDHLRRRRVATISMDGAPDATTASQIEATSFELASHGESALDALEAKELGGAIERAISGLRPEYRACIMLRHVEDRSYEEIAATLDLPLGTVKTYIHRARHELRKALEDAR